MVHFGPPISGNIHLKARPSVWELLKLTSPATGKKCWNQKTNEHFNYWVALKLITSNYNNMDIY